VLCLLAPSSRKRARALLPQGRPGGVARGAAGGLPERPAAGAAGAPAWGRTPLPPAALGLQLGACCPHPHRRLSPPQARSVGDDSLVEGLRASCRVMEIQIAVRGRTARLLAAAQRGEQQPGDGGAERVRRAALNPKPRAPRPVAASTLALPPRLTPTRLPPAAPSLSNPPPRSRPCSRRCPSSTAPPSTSATCTTCMRSRRGCAV
jgi:hypothetical protein